MGEKVEFEAEVIWRFGGVSLGPVIKVYGDNVKPGQRYHVTLEPVGPELKPCPFCGGEAGIVTQTCNGSVVETLCGCDCCGVWLHCPGNAEAIATEAWNRREG